MGQQKKQRRNRSEIPNVPIPAGPYLNTVEAAALLRKTINSLDGLCAQRKIPYSKPGKDRLFKKEDLKALVDNHYHPPIRISA